MEDNLVEIKVKLPKEVLNKLDYLVNVSGYDSKAAVIANSIQLMKELYESREEDVNRIIIPTGKYWPSGSTKKINLNWKFRR